MLFSFLVLCTLCVFSIKPRDTIPAYAATYGIPVETHNVTTDDGYILTMFRLVNEGHPVVYLQHGILASAWCWLDNKPEHSPGFALWHMGYDVWLGNNRGNTFSRGHTHLNPNSAEYWNFTFVQMAKYDLPKQTGYVIDTTGAQNLTYFGWSQGVTQLFIAGILPETQQFLKERINLAIAVSPVSYLKYSTSTLINIISTLHIGDVIYSIWKKGFLTGSENISYLEQLFCRLTFGVVCEFTIDLICGASDKDDPVAITNLTAHFPAGAPMKDLIHYEQWVTANVFQDFDYGKKENRNIYGGDTPPAFDLTKFDIPIFLLAGTDDHLVGLKDYDHLTQLLPLNTVKGQHIFDDFSHVTWLVGDDSAWEAWWGIVERALLNWNPPFSSRPHASIQKKRVFE